MAFCSNCGQELADCVKFCSECGTPTGKVDETIRRTVFSGEIHKCPSCGEVLQSMTAICPSCGHEINSAKLSSALKEFINEINECDKIIANTPKKEMPKKGWKTWKKSTRILWVILNFFTSCIPLVIYLTLPLFRPLIKSNATPELSSIEQRKVALIENFTFPNDRESVLEALLFTKSKMEFLASEKANEKNAFWLRLWNTKATQLHQKANILLSNDAIAETAYSGITTSKKMVDKKVRIRAAIGAAIIIIFVLIVVLNGSLYNGILKILPNSSSSVIENERFEWMETGLSTKIPTIDVKSGLVQTNSDTELWLSLNGVTYSQFEKYITSCKEVGYTVDAEKDTHTYKAYNGEGYLLEVSCWGENLSIELKAPLVGDENFKWPSHDFASLIPQLNKKTGIVETETEETLKIMLYEVSIEDIRNYIGDCENVGFTIDVEKEDTSFNGFNVEGYELSILYNEMKAMSITINAPMEFGKISWPSSGPATLIPKPSFNVGKISSDYDWAFSVYIGDMTLAEFNSYVDKCIDKGFEKDLRTEHYFSASKGKDVSLTVEYVGFNTVVIHIYDYDKF